MIVAALATGASAGLTNTATAAVQDAYEGLKNILQRRLGFTPVVTGDAADPAVWTAEIGGELTRTGADADRQVLEAAHRLLALQNAQAGVRQVSIDAPSAQAMMIGDANTQHNTFN